MTEYTIEGEFSENGHNENTLSFERGTLGLARLDYSMYYYYTGDSSYLTEGYNSGCAQFFITAEDCSEYFDGYYCAFGKVIEGMEIIDQVKAVETVTETDEDTINASDILDPMEATETTTDEGAEKTTKTTTPVNPPVITKMTVDTFGINYNEPEIITE